MQIISNILDREFHFWNWLRDTGTRVNAHLDNRIHSCQFSSWATADTTGMVSARYLNESINVTLCCSYSPDCTYIQWYLIQCMASFCKFFYLCQIIVVYRCWRFCFIFPQTLLLLGLLRNLPTRNSTPIWRAETLRDIDLYKRMLKIRWLL